MDRMKMESPDLVSENIKKIECIFQTALPRQKMQTDALKRP